MKCAQESQRKGQKEDEQEVSGWMRKKSKKKRKKKKKVSGDWVKQLEENIKNHCLNYFTIFS